VRNPVQVHQGYLTDTALQHRDPRVDDLLALFGRFVLRVLTQITELSRALDLLGQFELELSLECRNFVAEFLQNAIFHR
jgi:hypothetical protein